MSETVEEKMLEISSNMNEVCKQFIEFIKREDDIRNKMVAHISSLTSFAEETKTRVIDTSVIVDALISLLVDTKIVDIEKLRQNMISVHQRYVEASKQAKETGCEGGCDHEKEGAGDSNRVEEAKENV